MDFELIGAVLELISHGGRLPWQFFRLAHGDESGAEAVGQRRGENKSARFDSGDDVDFLSAVMLAELVDQLVEPLSILKQRGQVIKQDSRFRVIGNFADQFS